MNFATYTGTAEQYIREYLDPDGTLGDEPVSASEARQLWASLNDVFRDDGGTGIDEDVFVAAVIGMTPKHRCIYCDAELPGHADMDNVSDPRDRDSWRRLADEHRQGCEWIETRAHRLREPRPVGDAPDSLPVA